MQGLGAHEPDEIHDGARIEEAERADFGGRKYRTPILASKRHCDARVRRFAAGREFEQQAPFDRENEP